MPQTVSLYEAKTQLSGLVDQAANGAEIVISKNGVPYAKLVPIAQRGTTRKPAKALNIAEIAADFDRADTQLTALFEGTP